MVDFYVPNSKYELVYMLSDYYPQDKNKFKSMKKKQLYAIYYKIRKQQQFDSRIEDLLLNTGNIKELVNLIEGRRGYV